MLSKIRYYNEEDIIDLEDDVDKKIYINAL